MSEFSIIDQYCQGIGVQHPETRIGVGDDAAIVAVPTGQELVVCVDTMVEGVHFFADSSPAALAQKLLAVNLSDLAAMGAKPMWATLALTLPNSNADWLEQFSSSLHQCAERYGVELIGGDTTSGPRTASLQIMGLVPAGRGLTRGGASAGEQVYVSGTLGDAALALMQFQETGQIKSDLLAAALHRPMPQIELGEALLNVATAAIDISDGLSADLSHIARASGVSIAIDLNQVPLSDAFSSEGGQIEMALTGGDDYQLAFTASQAVEDELHSLARELGVQITRIGTVQSVQSESVIFIQDGVIVTPPDALGFDHFG